MILESTICVLHNLKIGSYVKLYSLPLGLEVQLSGATAAMINQHLYT